MFELTSPSWHLKFSILYGDVSQILSVVVDVDRKFAVAILNFFALKASP